MVKVTNIFGDVYSGQAGKAGVFANWKGRQYRRKYVVPSNPNTAMQQAVRTSFTNAVDLWHTFLSNQRLAYGYMATGLTMSGFNLLVSRWQKMTAGERTAYVNPYLGMKQVGSDALTAVTQIDTEIGVAEYTADATPLALGETTYTQGGDAMDIFAIADINRGRINIPQDGLNPMTISYESLGRVITDEVVHALPVAEDIFYTEYWPIDYKTVAVKIDAVEVDALEVDIVTGKIYCTKTLPTTVDADIDAKSYTPLDLAKVETRKVDTNFVTWRGYTDENGLLTSAQTSEDGNRDTKLELSGYVAQIKANISALDAAKDEYLQMIAV